LRREDAPLLGGRARFVDNLHLDRMAHGVFIRSTMAHAEIVSIDASKALAAGALCVLTARDLAFNERPWVVRYWHPSIRNGMPRFLPHDRVRFVGEPVAFLAAASRYEAEDLAALVQIEYRPLPVLSTIEEALAEGAPQLHPEWTSNIAATFGHAQGNVRDALDGAVHRARRTFRFGRQTPLPLETRGIVADYDAERAGLTVWMSTQAHYNVRQNLATVLDLPEYQVRVVAEDVGGGFGAKSRAYAEEVVVSHASRVLRRPVKWIEDRFENLQATTHSRAIDVDLELACDGEGRFTALKALLTLDLGAYVFTSGVMTSEVAAAHIANAYRIPSVAIDVRCVGTNKTPVGTYRGAGQPEACFPVECLVEVLAKQMGVAAADLRRRNMVRPADLPFEPGTTLAGGKVRFESADFPRMLDAVIEASGYAETVETTPQGERCAWGLACGIEASGFVNFETALVRVDTLGNVTVLSGMTTQGQGQLTTYAQVCAEALGVDFERVRVRLGDTQLVPFGRGAFASRGAIFGANAVLGAAETLRGRILSHAAMLLQCEPAALTIRRGRIWRIARDPEKWEPVFGRDHAQNKNLGRDDDSKKVRPALDGEATDLDVAQIARAVAPGGPLFSGDAALEAQFVYKTDQPLTYGLTVHAAKIRLDRRTGFFRVIDYVVGHDAGRSLNAIIVEGQIVGGVADGIGGALFSELVYDGDGQLLTGSLADYLVGTAPEIPRIRLVHLETRPGTNPLGVRGIGEGGVIPAAAAIANALARAIDPTSTGFESALFTLPLKPERVFAACRAAQRSDAPPAV
jgi:carbon-monoxide dehydrogenase large subunit